MKKLSALFLASIFLSANYASADVIYRETFDNTSGTQLGFNTAGWTALRSTNGGTPVDSSNNNNSFGISIANGTPTSAGPGVNAGTNGVGTATGLPFQTGGTYYAFNYTTEATSAVTSGMLTQISFYEGNANVNFTMQPLVRVGAQWYVSNQTFANPTALTGAQFPTDAVQQILNINGSTQWKTISFDTASTFNTSTSISSTTASLPAGQVTAWGLYGDYSNGAVGSSNARFDNFTVSTVPEPATNVAAAIMGAFTLLTVLRRARRRC